MPTNSEAKASCLQATGLQASRLQATGLQATCLQASGGGEAASSTSSDLQATCDYKATSTTNSSVSDPTIL